MGLLLGLAYGFAVWLSLAGVASSGATPDTASYLDFSPYRQPLYGLWAHFLFQATGSWSSVVQFQTALFILAVAWTLVELARISTLGVIAAVALASIHLVLLRMGLVALVGTLATEGLFYTMIMAGAALMLAWLRTRSRLVLALALLLVVTMTQLRTAALLACFVPLGAAAIALVAYGWRSPQGRVALGTIAALVALVAVLPAMTGKKLFQVGTPQSWLGFAALPRISLLHLPPDVAERAPHWTAMASGWQTAAKGLDAIEMGQFDAQLQEAIRYELAPKALLPEYLRIDVAQSTRQWTRGELYNEATTLFLRCIRSDPWTYARLSLAHFWGLMTMGNFMSNGQRANVWRALNELPAPTWQLARFRTDYPLNRIDQPLSRASSLLYYGVRYALILVLALGMVAVARSVLAVCKRRDVPPGDLALLAAIAWAALHSVPAALTVFAEFRYTYANLLCLSAGGLAWFAYLGHGARQAAMSEARA